MKLFKGGHARKTSFGSEEERQRHLAIEKGLKEAAQQMRKQKKILLLGTGDSGKSTLAKQMRIIHTDGFTAEEKAEYKRSIYANVIGFIATLVRESSGVAPDNEEHAELITKIALERNLVPPPRSPTQANGEEEEDEEVTGSGKGKEKAKAKAGVAMGLRASGNVPELGPEKLDGLALKPDIVAAVKALWNDSHVQEALKRANEFVINLSSQHFVEDIDRLAASDYVPSNQDILFQRKRTCGVQESTFNVEGHEIRMIDAAGQRGEREKWIHCFSEVTAVIFVAATNEYDMLLEEDGATNRLEEALQLFNDLINSKWFHRTPFILFLNKDDLFQEKIKRVDLKVLFPEYTGGKDYDNAIKFIKKQFRSQVKKEGDRDRVYIHTTCATDTNQIKHIWQDVQTSLLVKCIDASGF
ncbi:Guanine nucleotide-binding protein G(t) subunit alpha-2 [Balamuthia mandrillaris]